MSWLLLSGLLAWTGPHALDRFSPSPDGRYYQESPRPAPYCWRWLIPLLGRWPRAWMLLSWASMLLMTGLMEATVPWSGSLWLVLATARTHARLPLLTDQAGQLLMLGLMLIPDWRWAVPLSLLGGAVNEKAPLFAALLTGRPELLLGLLGAAPGYAWKRDFVLRDPDWLQHPLAQAWARLETLDWKLLLAPWGPALPGLVIVSPLGLAAAYLQLLVAQDNARLYQWIAPAVCLAAAGWWMAHLPGWMPLLLLAGWANPWRRVL